MLFYFIQAKDFVWYCVFILINLNSFVVTDYCWFMIVELHELVAFGLVHYWFLSLWNLLETVIYLGLYLFRQLKLKHFLQYGLCRFKLTFPSCAYAFSDFYLWQSQSWMRLFLFIPWNLRLKDKQSLITVIDGFLKLEDFHICQTTIKYGVEQL